MPVVAEFCDAVGLSESVRAWLSKNQGDPLREDIVAALMLAIDANLSAESRGPLRRLIAKIPVARSAFK